MGRDGTQVAETTTGDGSAASWEEAMDHTYHARQADLTGGAANFFLVTPPGPAAEMTDAACSVMVGIDGAVVVEMCSQERAGRQAGGLAGCERVGRAGREVDASWVSAASCSVTLVRGKKKSSPRPLSRTAVSSVPMSAGRDGMAGRQPASGAWGED